VTRFLNATRTLDWDRDAADAFADWYERLRGRGELIPDRDLMIAAHAISLGAVLVTNNIRHFNRLAPELAIENWSEPIV
jgi:tRNA(fMet)-specific endonuclease VapC